MSSTEYWALSDEIGQEIESKIENFRNNLRMLPLMDVWRNAFNAVHRALSHMGDVLNIGENGEYSGVYVNDYRSLTESKLNMIFAQVPAFDCKAVNTDFEAQIAAQLGNGLLEYYMRDKDLKYFIRKAVTHAYQIYGEMFFIAEWDVDGGDEYGANEETGAIIREGDIALRVAPPQLVVRDYMAKSNKELDWYIVTRFVSKYKLAAKFPEYADKIISLSYDYTNEFYSLSPGVISNRPDADTDLIPLHVMYHMPSMELPNGRLVEYVDGQVLSDSPMPYKNSPVIRVSIQDIEDTIWSYTEAWDLLPIEKIKNNLHSTVATNQSTWGVTSVIVPAAANINKTNLGGGLKVFDYKGNVEPKQFNISSTPGDTYNYMDKLVNIQEKLLSIPAIRRGAPENNIKSGNFAALVASQALENSANVQYAYEDLCTKSANQIIKVLQDFANVPRIAMIAGKSNRSYMKEFKGSDLTPINRVFVDLGSPLAASMAGRMELAGNYINLPPEWRDQWINIINTGRVENVVEENSSEILLIKSENESLQDGKSVQALIIEDHVKHIKGHKRLLSNPEAKQNAQLVDLVLSHIQEHIDLLNSGDPMLEFSTSTPQQAPPPPPMPPANPVQDAAANVNMPQMPIDPMTGEQFTPQTPQI